MTELVQTPPTTRPRSRFETLILPVVLPIAVLAPLLLWLYARVLAHLVAQWWHDPNFSHGFFVPLFSAYVLWQERDRLARIARQHSRFGLLIITFALCVLIVGQLGAELFLARFSLLLTLAGLIVLFLGWPFFRAAFFPWAFLLLMVPIPVILFNQITFPLQLLASRISADALELFGVPVALNGNVLQLAAMPLNVAEACSGIRSLMSLLTLAIIYGYLSERRLWVRCLLALASLPIAIAANSVRIVGTGLLVQYGYADAAEGYFHASWGIITFVISLLMLYALHALIRALWREKASSPHPEPIAPTQASAPIPASSFVAAALILAAVAIFLQFRGGRENYPPRAPLNSFPQQFASWTGTDIPIDPDTLEVLGHGEFLHRVYERGHETDSAPGIDLFLAYFPSQRAGETPHSPQHCLPGSGWVPIENHRLTLTVPGHAPFPANRYVIAKDNSREMVLYFFWAHNRGVASEYWAKYYLVKDAIEMNRSDGALIRIVTSISPHESPEAAQQRLLPFAAQVLPMLDRYVPR